MIGGNEELNNYVVNAGGIGRMGLNIMCFIGVFIFGWLLAVAFDSLGKKGTGWFYLVPIIFLLVISRQGDATLALVAPVIYLVGWVHANLVLSNYQKLARTRIMALESEPPSADVLLEKGILYHKVLQDKHAASTAFSEAAAQSGGDADLLNRAGVALLAVGNPQEALTFFDRALAGSTDTKMGEQIKKNRERAEKAAAKPVAA